MRKVAFVAVVWLIKVWKKQQNRSAIGPATERHYAVGVHSLFEKWLLSFLVKIKKQKKDPRVHRAHKQDDVIGCRWTLQDVQRIFGASFQKIFQGAMLEIRQPSVILYAGNVAHGFSANLFMSSH